MNGIFSREKAQTVRTQFFLKQQARRFAALGLLLLASCTPAVTPPVNVLEAPNSLVFDLLIQNVSGFRRYHIVREVLWQECGKTQEESFAPSETHVSMLTEAERKQLLSLLNQLLESVRNQPLPEAELENQTTVELNLRQNEKANVFKSSEQALQSESSQSAKALLNILQFISKKNDLTC